METAIWQEYENGIDYQRRMGFRERFPEYIRFKEGDQWPPATARTRNLPRPVFNIVEMFIRTKRAAVLNPHIAMTYLPVTEEAAQGARDLTDYTQQLWKRMEQDRLNEELMDDAATLGTGALHYYFDPHAEDPGTPEAVGEIRGESIDPLNLFFGDPQQTEIQKQPYVMIATRQRVRDVRRLAAEMGVPETMQTLIAPDDAAGDGYEAARAEIRDADKCTVLTKYYRVNGAVVYDQATRQVELVHGRSLTPAGRKPITRYPVVLMAWKPRKASIYGIGETEGLIPNQKAINFNLAMLLLSVQQTAWPKLVSTPGAIRQPVTNEPGEHLIDYSAGGGGIRYLNPPAFGSTAMNLSGMVLELSRTVAGVSEVSTGEMTGRNMAASAIIALQNQARTPIVEIQRRFWTVLRQAGQIRLQFIRAYYVFDRAIAAVNRGETHGRTFRGSKYSDTPFDLTVDVGASSEFSEVLSQSTLDSFLANGYATVDQYIDLAPVNVVPFKERLKQMRADAEREAEERRGEED